MIDCKQALLKLFDYIDGELNPTDYAEVEEHLKNCKHCFGKAEFQRMTKRIIREKAGNESVPVELKNSILNRINQLNNTSNPEPPVNPGGARKGQPPDLDHSSFSHTAVTVLSIAAIAIFFIAGIFGFALKGAAGTPGVMAEQYASLPDPYPAAEIENERHLETAFGDVRPPFVPCYICDRTKILSAATDNEGNPVHKRVLFEINGHTLLFYCLDSGDFSPGWRMKHVSLSNRDYYLFKADDGCCGVFWKVNGCVNALVGSLPADKLLMYAGQMS